MNLKKEVEKKKDLMMNEEMSHLIDLFGWNCGSTM